MLTIKIQVHRSDLFLRPGNPRVARNYGSDNRVKSNKFL